MIFPSAESSLTLLIIAPLAAATLTYLLSGVVRDLVATAVTVVVLFFSISLVVAVAQGGAFAYQIGGWHAPIGIRWHVDGLATVMVSMTTAVMTMAALYAPAYFGAAGAVEGASRLSTFWPLFFFVWAALNALFLSADVFNLYVTLELLTLGSVGLIVLVGSTAALTAAIRYLILGLLASMLYLLGVTILYATYGTLDLAQLSQVIQADLATWLAASLMVSGLMLKTALFPLHFWLPPAHAGAPAPVSALLSALVVKASFYLILRLWTTALQQVAPPMVDELLAILGAGAIAWGATLALQAERLKMLVAYSTVAQLGYLFVALPLLDQADDDVRRTAFAGIVLFAVAHALAKASLFLAAGEIAHLAGGDNLRSLSGVGDLAPLPVSATVMAGISLMGLPPSGGFAGKWLLLLAAVQSGRWWIAIVIVLGGLLTAGYLFRFWNIAIAEVGGPQAARPRGDWRLSCPPLLLAVAALLIVFAATPISEFVLTHAAPSASGGEAIAP